MNKFRRLGLLTLIILALFLFWLKFSGDSIVKQAMLKALPLPVVLVENQPIWSNQLLERLEDYRLVYGKNSMPSISEAKKTIQERLIFEKKLEILARKERAELLGWEQFSGSVLEENSKNALLSRAAEVLGREDAFKFWYYSQKPLNQEGYKLADFLVEEINQGRDFGLLAKTYGQVPPQEGIEGDLGPLKVADVLFELKEPLLQAKTGQILILPSRLGLHVTWVYLKKVSETGEDMLYLKQIYLPGNDFKEWVEKETKNYKIINIIKI